LEDFKAMQDNLKKKLNMQNQSLIYEREQMVESLRQIEYKFKIDIEKYIIVNEFCFLIVKQLTSLSNMV